MTLFRPAVAGRSGSAAAGLFLLGVAATSWLLAPSGARAGDLIAGGGTRSRFNVVLTDRLGPWVAGHAAGTPGLVLDAGLLAIDTRVTPIAWLSLSAQSTAEGVRLAWTITADSDPVGFVVERGDAAFVASGSSGPSASDSPIAAASEETYVRLTPAPLASSVREFLDPSPPAVMEVTYRLIGIDRAGRTFVTDPLLVSLDPKPLPFAVTSPAPNPSSGRTALTIDLPTAGPVRLRAFDITGRLVADAFDAALPAGRHQLTWDAGSSAAGVYFLRVEAAGRHEVRRVVLAR